MSERAAHPGAAPRLLRAAVFTVVCVMLGATGHSMAACAPVPGWTLALGCLAVFTVAAPLAGRTRSTGFTVVALTGGQLALHSLFALSRQDMTTASGDGATAAGMSSMAGMPGMTASHQQMPMAPAMHMEADGLLPSLPMVLGHLLAALATSWLLRRGDLALLRLARFSAHGIGEVTDDARLRTLWAAVHLVRALLTGLPALPVPVVNLPGVLPEPPRAQAGETLQHTVVRRGPPAGVSLAA